MVKKNRRHWRLTVAAAVVVSIVSFTPLVLSWGEPGPFFLGMPHTLWAGMLVAFVLVLLTYLGARLHPEIDEPGEDL